MSFKTKFKSNFKHKLNFSAGLVFALLSQSSVVLAQEVTPAIEGVVAKAQKLKSLKKVLRGRKAR